MVHAAIEISPSAVRTRVSELRPGEVEVRLDRFVPVEVGTADPARIEMLVADGAEAARSAGSEEVEVVIAPELKGTRIARLVGRRVSRFVSGVRTPGTGALIASRFIASTTAHVPDPDVPVGVAGIGHDSLGVAVGRPGSAPDWIGSRPFGVDRLASKARFQDPPTPVQLDVARVATARALATMQPPEFGDLLVVSDFESTIRDLCGTEISSGGLAGALDWVMGRTSDELVAVTGFERHLARLLPASIAIHQALAEVFGSTIVPVAPDPAAELALAEIGPAPHSGDGPE